jgi:hypothetical protein
MTFFQPFWERYLIPVPKHNYNNAHETLAKRDTFLRLCLTPRKPTLIRFHRTLPI